MLKRHFLYGGLVWMILATSAPVAASGQEAMTKLTPGSEVSRSIRYDEEHSFQLAPQTGHNIDIQLRQQGINVGVTVFGPNGNILFSQDVQKHVQATERAFFEVKNSGTHRIKVTPLPGFAIETGRDRNAFIWDGERSVPYELVNTSGEYTLLVNQTPTSKDKLGEVDQLFRPYSDAGNGGVAVGIVKDGEPVFLRGYGLANIEYGIPVSPHTPFHIASVSKQFAAYALAALHDEGKLSLDDDIRKYLPELKISQKISIRQMLNHTSGIRDQWTVAALAGWRMDDVITQQQLLRLIFNQESLNFNPGDEYRYSNSNYTLAAEIVRRVTGRTLREWTTAEVFEPLNMTRTFFYDDHEEILPDRAYSYDDRSGTVKKSVLSFANSGATSLFTTVNDFVKWMANFKHQSVGNARVFELLCEPGKLNNGSTTTYALGVAVGRYKEQPTINHSGVDAGYRSFMLYFPERDLGIIILSNQASCNTVQLAHRVADILLELPAEQPVNPLTPKPRTEPYEGLSEKAKSNADYVGVYYNREIQTEYHIVGREGKIFLTHKRFEDAELIPTGPEKFKGTYWIFNEVEFHRDRRGRITGLAVSNRGVTEMEFIKLSDNR